MPKSKYKQTYFMSGKMVLVYTQSQRGRWIQERCDEGEEEREDEGLSNLEEKITVL